MGAAPDPRHQREMLAILNNQLYRSIMRAVQGASHVSAYVTHGVFPNGTWKRFTPEGRDTGSPGFRYFWISDSCANTAAVLANVEPFEVLSLAEPIAAALQI